MANLRRQLVPSGPVDGRRGENGPFVGHALQIVRASLGEFESGTYDEVFHRLRYDDLSSRREVGNSRTDMDGCWFS